MPDTKIQIRQAGLNDITRLTEISSATFYHAFAHLNKAEDIKHYMEATFTESNLRQELNFPGSSFYFAEANDKIAGYIKLNDVDAQTEHRDLKGLEVQRLYVLSDYQGNKIGEQLIEFAAAQARAKGRHCIWLGVWEHNVNAIRFYTRAGFSVFSRHDFMLGEDCQTDLLMKKDL